MVQWLKAKSTGIWGALIWHSCFHADSRQQVRSCGPAREISPRWAWCSLVAVAFQRLPPSVTVKQGWVCAVDLSSAPLTHCEFLEFHQGEWKSAGGGEVCHVRWLQGWNLSARLPLGSGFLQQPICVRSCKAGINSFSSILGGSASLEPEFCWGQVKQRFLNHFIHFKMLLFAPRGLNAAWKMQGCSDWICHEDRAQCVESSVCTGSSAGYHPGLLPSCAPLSRHTLGGTEDDHVYI